MINYKSAKKLQIFALVIGLIFHCGYGYAESALAPREKLSLDLGWKFHLGDIEGYTNDVYKGGGDGGTPAAINFNDSTWRGINLPHDFMVETPIDSIASNVNGSLSYGIGWYRRSFKVSSVDKGKRFILTFDGISRFSYVFVNGFQVKFNRSGYIGFSVDITEALNFGAENVIAVRVNTGEGAEGWWYEGGGIYRHVWLEKCTPVYIPPYGVAINPALDSTLTKASVEVKIEVSNEGEKSQLITPEIRFVDAKGNRLKSLKGLPEIISAGEKRILSLKMPVENLLLWTPENPNLYSLETYLIQDNIVVDGITNQIGFRSFTFDTINGFLVNGKKEIIKGVCLHQDHAGVGIAVPDALWRYRLKKLKELGVNGIRMHHPIGSELIQLCNEMGFFLLGETRHFSGFSDQIEMFERMVKMKRNAPSVFAWCLGNEETLQGDLKAVEIVKKMRRIANLLDLQRRPVTMAFNGETNGVVAKEVDVVGYNYGTGRILGNISHGKPIFSSESASMLTTRGEYKTDSKRKVASSYDRKAVSWGQSAEEVMDFTMNMQKLAGTFIWTGFDYRGEPTPYGWPNVSCDFGILDLCGFRKDLSYFFEAWWSNHDVLHILPHWNWEGSEKDTIDVWVYSNYHEVELMLNGNSLGKKIMPKYKHIEWKVPYKKGTLLAKGFRGGKEVATASMTTAGTPSIINIKANCKSIVADEQDVVVFDISICDKNNIECPDANNLLRFSLTGPGNILGVGNGNPGSHEADKLPIRRAFHGKAQVIVQSTNVPGDITLTVTSGDLNTQSITIKSTASKLPAMRISSNVKNVEVLKFYPEKPDNNTTNSAKKAWTLEEMYEKTAGYSIEK